MNISKDKFYQKYGEKEVKLPWKILTIRDNYPGPLSSGSNGYLTKVRLKDGKFEFYHDWWDYGWLQFNEIEKQYPHTLLEIEECINTLI